MVLEENPNFVTLDEVGEEEEEKITPRTRGRPRKRTKKTPGNTSVTITIHLFIKNCSLLNNKLAFLCSDTETIS